MWTIECAGHPRDMGLAQGGACASTIRAACEAAGLPLRRSRFPTLRALHAGSVRGAGAGREFLRHFAHQAERLEGLARAANVPFDSVELHLRARAGGVEAGLLARRTRLRAYSHSDAALGKRTLLERTLPAVVSGEVGWILRESRSSVGFRSVEIGLPWLVSGVAGVNEAGLAAMAGADSVGAQPVRRVGRPRRCCSRNVCSGSKISPAHSTGVVSDPSKASNPSCSRTLRAGSPR